MLGWVIVVRKRPDHPLHASMIAREVAHYAPHLIWANPAVIFGHTVFILITFWKTPTGLTI
jgi:hypothetical protein